ncbi:MAG TPA: hypothetical protein VF719_13595, partial [Abditibacteriaceae bacterium]
VWKAHRERLFNGTIIPIGNVPDGTAWTGFLSYDRENPQAGGYALLFRELNMQATWTESTRLFGCTFKGEVLSGEGTARIENGTLYVDIPQAQSYLFVRLS